MIRRSLLIALFLLSPALIHAGAAATTGLSTRTTAAEIPPPYLKVLAKHRMDAPTLASLGFVFKEGQCWHITNGVVVGTAYSPEALDSALTKAVARAKAPAAPRPLAGMPDKSSTGSWSGFFDGNKTGDELPPLQPEAGASAAPQWQEPEFAPDWHPIAQKIWSGKKDADKAVHALASRFQSNHDSPTGLSPDAPEALRMLALVLYDHKGGIPARKEFSRELVLIASATTEAQKNVFAASLQSPLPVLLSLSLSNAPHFHESQQEFKRMVALLNQNGLTLSDYLNQVDPKQLYSAAFLLRAQVYDALIPYLQNHPNEAGAIAPLLFSDKKPASIRSEASRLEGLAMQLAAGAPQSRAWTTFVSELIAQAAGNGPAAKPAALFLRMNAELIPLSLRSSVLNTEPPFSEELLEDPKLIPPSPFDYWPSTGPFVFTIHFPYPNSYQDWLNYFLKHGYALSETQGGVSIKKNIQGTDVILTATLYNGEKGFLIKGSTESARFFKNVILDLKDKNVQGVIVRTHAQFHYPALFTRRVSPGKLWVDGSCRGSWYQEEYERLCPTCSIVDNTATGEGQVTDPALYDILEGLARKEDWNTIYRRMRKHSPINSAHFTGPWTPPYGKALDLLKHPSKD